MVETFQDKIRKAEAQLIPGDFDKAIELIDKVLGNKDITKQEKLQAQNQKVEILNYFGYHKEAIEIAEKVLKESSKKTANSSIILIAKANKNQAELMLGIIDFTAGVKQIDELLQEINDFDKKTTQEHLKEKVILLAIKGAILGSTGKIQEGLENIENAIVIAKQLGSKHYELQYSTQQAFVHIVNNNSLKAEEILEQNLRTAQELGNKKEEAFVYMRFGVLELYRFSYKKSLEYYLKSEQMMNEAKSKHFYSGLCSNLGALYLSMYQLDDALTYCQKALEFGLATQHMHFTIATVYFWKNELTKAQESYLSALKVAQIANDTRMLPVILYGLMRVAIEKNDLTTAKEYFQQIDQLQKVHTTILTTFYFKFAAVMIYKASTNISDWGKAAELLTGILQDAELNEEYKIDALFSLLEIRIKELQIQSTKEALTEVQKQLIVLQREAEDKKLYMVLVNIYRLKSKIALVELNIKKALELLVTARTLAEDRNLELLVHQINRDEEKIKEQSSMWNKFQEENTPLKDLLQEVNLDTTAKEIVKDSILEVRDKKSEEPVEYRKLFSFKF
ncbi:MAG: tetratricopeptide repeat protein [Candidatus Heimdallarchaeota archaeon]